MTLQGKPKRRRHPITNQLFTFTYPKVVTEYYRARHAVDDNNNVRQGSLGLEECLAVKAWHIRQFLALIAMAEVNAHAFYNYKSNISLGEGHKKSLSLVEFRDKLARALIHNMFLPQPNSDEHSESPTRRTRARTDPHHQLMPAPAYTGMYVDGTWTQVTSKYGKHKCSRPNCTTRIRTYCTCNPSKFLCTNCYYKDHN